jgi:hypothetical protein
MKIKHYKILTLLSVFTLVGLTHSLTLKDLNASLTAPADYDYFFRSIDNPSPAPDFWRLGDWNGTSSPNGSNDLRFTRTADSTYFNYSITTNHTTHSFLPDGLEITMTFNRSNTSWTQVSGTSLYNPTDYNKIGSDNTVGTINDKWLLRFNNQTSKNYLLFLDNSSTNSVDRPFEYSFDNNKVINNAGSYFYFASITTLNQFYIPSFTNVLLRPITVSTTNYLDAWYLKDIGVSAAYDAGYEQGDIDGYADGLGNNPNVLLSGFQAMVGILVNFALMIVNLEVFGVSLIGIFSIVVLLTGIVWTLKLIRG